MAKIKPFKALRYNTQKFSDISCLICPPYDVISPSAQEYYHNKSPYNIIHLEFGKNISGEDKYLRAANYFNSWIKEKVLILDESPAIYFYNQQFYIKGEKKERLGFFALLRLEDKENRVYPHEHTRLEPKEDRLRLLRRVKTNVSPIFVLFSDHNRIIRRTYEKYLRENEPLVEAIDDDGVRHKIWKLDLPQALEEFQSQMNSEHIFIADGHHRYEVATSYRDKMLKRRRSSNKDFAFNYIMAYFTNIESRGLSIFPIHRLVKKLRNFNIEKFKLALSQYFDIQEVKDKSQFFFLMEKAGTRENILGMYSGKRFYLLRLKNVKILDKEMVGKPKEYRSLDVSILNHFVFKRILKLDWEDKNKIIFSIESNELITQVDEDKANAAFFLNPVKIEHLVSIAREGERMPSKSTYFYPKIPTGLLINKFQD